MPYAQLADYVVLSGINAPYDGVIELIRRGSSQADYLLRYVKDDFYHSSDSFEDKIVPAIAIGIIACLKRRDLWEEILPYLSDSYDFLLDIFDQFIPSILSDLLPENISRIKDHFLRVDIHKFLLSDIIEAYRLMAERSIVSKQALVDFLKDGIVNHTDISLTSMFIWVALDIGASELKPHIDDAFRDNRVDLDIITQDDITFQLNPSIVHTYLNPVQFFDPSNLKEIEESIDDEVDPSEMIHNIYHNIGVNDQCPCNSGKKFKKCCRPIIIEREKFMELEGRVWKHLDKCRYSDIFKQYIAEAYKVFTKSVPGKITKTNDIFLSWAIHDFLVPGKNKSMLSLYLEEYSSSIREDERDVLKGLLFSNFVIVEVERVIPYLGYYVSEIFPGNDPYFITDTLSISQVSNHSLLLLRLYRIKTLNRIGGGALKIPYSEIGYIQELSKEFINKYLSDVLPENRNNLTLSRFISKNSLSLITAVYERSRRSLFPQIISPEGDPVVFNSSTYKIEDMPYVMNSLKQDSRFDYDPGSGKTFIWKGPLDTKKHDPVNTEGIGRIYGTILLDDHSITVECFTHKRWEICVNLLKSILGDKMGPEIIKSETGIADAIMANPRIGDGEEDQKSPEMRELEQRVINAYYMKWLDEKIPLLGGKTPREAAKDPKLRQQLILLLNEMENTSGPVSKVPRPPIEKMKRDLGL